MKRAGDPLARRIVAWLSHAPLILHDADEQIYRRFLRSLVRQVRYLRHTAIEARDGVPRMQALVALAYAALCMAGQTRHMRGTIKQLVAEIDRQILPDGGHISRNPGALIDLLSIASAPRVSRPATSRRRPSSTTPSTA